jgi:flagellar hook assembly protein FlgD
MERISWEGPVNDPNNWHSAARSAGYATPGFMNSQYRPYEKISAQFEVEPRVFVPDNSGQADFTSIRYHFDEPGHVATIRIFDAYGRKVKDLLQNVTLSTEDAIQWDGTDNHHQKVKMGYYLIYIEVFHLNGEKQVYKEKVAVAARF